MWQHQEKNPVISIIQLFSMDKAIWPQNIRTEEFAQTKDPSVTGTSETNEEVQY